MRSQLMILMTVITASVTVQASAAPVVGTATLEASAKTGLVTGDASIWRCQGTSCSGTTSAVTSVAVSACSSIADANGRVTAFAAGPTSFGEAELKRCNRHVKP